MGDEFQDYSDSEYNENYQYSQDDLDTSNQYTPSQGVDSFLGNQGNYQIDGNYFGQDQDWGNQNWGMENQQTNFGGMFGPQQQGMSQQLPQQPQGGSQDFLSRLFQNPSGLLKLGGALMSGDQNKKRASAYGQIARDPRLDPFGSQRGQYQQMASQFANTPTNNPVYQNIQAETMRKLQMQAAATGRRTNPTDVMARLQSAMMPQYNDTLRNYAQLGGSQFGPQGSTIADMLSKSANAKTEGYASPVMNALGNLFKNDELDQGKQQAAAALSKYLNGA